MSEEPASEAPVDEAPASIDRTAMIRDALLIAAGFTAPLMVVTALIGDPDLAISLGIGWMIGSLNLVLLARGIEAAIARTLANIAESRREGSSEPSGPAQIQRPSGVGGAMRLALGLGAVVILLWLHPERPEGLAFGVVLILIGAAASAQRHNRRRQR